MLDRLRLKTERHSVQAADGRGSAEPGHCHRPGRGDRRPRPRRRPLAQLRLARSKNWFMRAISARSKTRAFRPSTPMPGFLSPNCSTTLTILPACPAPDFRARRPDGVKTWIQNSISPRKSAPCGRNGGTRGLADTPWRPVLRGMRSAPGCYSIWPGFESGCGARRAWALEHAITIGPVWRLRILRRGLRRWAASRQHGRSSRAML